MKRKITIIMGAAGRDFHNFNVYFRRNNEWDVVAFTTAQILEKHRTYPKELSGQLYKNGIAIHPESELVQLIKKFGVDYVFLSYSDLSHEDVMHKASIVLSSGSNFALLGPCDTMLKSKKPVISICAVRTGAGKSPATRYISAHFSKLGYKVIVIRHPMPYGDLKKQIVQRFASYKDLEKYNCTIEEREEYEPHIKNGTVVYAGVDYEKILKCAEKEADLILWDGGNNDFSFIKPDLHIVVADPHRAGHEIMYHPGEVNFRTADVILISKVNSAKKHAVKIVEINAKKFNPNAAIVRTSYVLHVNNAKFISKKKALVIEDGPTLTHGGMKFGAGTLAARRFGAEIIDAQKYAAGSLRNLYKEYPHLKKILPAMGYSKNQIKEMEKTINDAKCDIVIDGSPVNLSRLIKVNKPIVNVDYEMREIGSALSFILRNFEKKHLKL